MREEATAAVLKAKMTKRLTWAQISEYLGTPEVWTTAALLGQGTLTAEQAQKVGELLDLDERTVALLSTVPYRGTSVQMPPTDPVLYRLYEIILVYGPAFKEILQEKFGDGIMSAIDFEMKIERQPDPKGDRVLITMSGKYLPYKTP
jgi:cyanate lyase